MTWPYKYFSKEELMCKCGCGQFAMSETFMNKVESLREECGFPFVVTSGYRCPDYNDRIAKTGREGPHTTGHALDIGISHQQAFQLIAIAAKHGITGVGLDQKGDIKRRFVHIDDLLPPSYHGPRPHVWTY